MHNSRLACLRQFDHFEVNNLELDASNKRSFSHGVALLDIQMHSQTFTPKDKCIARFDWQKYMINLTPNWTDLEKFTTTNLNFKKLQLCQNRLLDFFASFSPFKIRQFVLNMEWTVTQKTLKHLHNIGQEYLECLHHMIASNQQNFPLLCCSGCANSTNFCLGILGFGYYIMHSKLKCQSSTNSKEKTHLQKHLTCQDPAPWKTIHTPQVLLVHAHKAAPFQSRGVPTAWRHEPG